MKNSARTSAVLLILSSIMGCTTTQKDFTPKTEADEGIVVGRVSLVVNGSDRTSKCVAVFGSFRHRYQLDNSGFVVLKLRKGESRLSGLFCGNETWGEQVSVCGGGFTVSSKEVTYLGDVKISWSLPPESTGSIVWKTILALGGHGFPPRTGGVAQISIEDKMDSTREEYEEKFQKTGHPQFIKSFPAVDANTQCPQTD
jgi:hypothetical protein